MHCSRRAFIVFALTFLLLSSLPVTQCCSSGYQFTTLPPLEVACNPYFIGHMEVICEITVAVDKPMADIHWYFYSSVASGSAPPIKLLNGISKHSIVNLYDESKKALKSTLRLQNVTDGIDTGQYICKGNIGSAQKLLPQPSFTILPQNDIPSFLFSCASLRLKESDNKKCARIVQVPVRGNTSLIISPSSAKVSLVEFSVRLQFTNLVPESQFVNSAELSITSQELQITMTKSTDSLVSVITSTWMHESLINMATPVAINSATVVKPIANENYIMIWLYIIVTLITASLFILVIILLGLMTLFFCSRSPPSSSTLEDVVLRQRTRRPSDPLPPIRDSMILMSNYPSETTTKSSNISGPAITTIHCSPLQNQFLSLHSLQDVTFSLQCPTASAFTVYAEVDSPSNESEGTRHFPRPDALGTYSSHAYTLPEDASYDMSHTNSLTGHWSPLLIQEEQRDRLSTHSLLSGLSDSLSDADQYRDSCSHDYYHGNRIVCQQALPSGLPRQTNSLTEQSFSLGDCHIVPAFSTVHKPLNSLFEVTASSGDCTSSLQLLFTDPSVPAPAPADFDSRTDNICSSSSSSSGCTDLSKYSGDYERDPDYMRALVTKMINDDSQHLVAHGQPSLCLNEEEQEERTLNDRDLIGLDSGMDGLYSGLDSAPSLDQSQLWSSSDDYKSLENLTRNPSPVYMKPIWRQNDLDSSVFTTITV